VTTTSAEQGQTVRTGRRRSARVRALVALPLVSLLTLLSLTAVTGTASAAPASASTPSQSGAARQTVLPVGAIEAGTGMKPDVNQVGCYVGDDFWDMKISGTWYCWANNGSVNIYPKYYYVSRIYTHNNSGTIWYDSGLGGLTSSNLADWTNYIFDGDELYVSGFTITGR
jgi:hypothetical protein